MRKWGGREEEECEKMGRKGRRKMRENGEEGKRRIVKD